ncbi:MAG: hypothetical protein ACI39C_15610 [Dietzia sp.]
MNEQHPRRPDDPWPEGGYGDPDRPAAPESENPTERFPTARYPAERPYEPPAFEPRADDPRAYEEQPFARPVEPLAHEGGFPYGMPPAAPYGAPAPYGYGEPLIPQHLHVPPQQFRPGPYPPPFGYPPVQQTVYVHGAPGRRVNHPLHLVLTVVTFGLWLPIWIVLAIANS